MKGLLIKDLKLLKTQKYFLIIVAAGCIGFLVAGKAISAVFAYASAIAAMVAVTTINYDENDNGMSFLFTFPVSRKKYVLEKYLFGMLLLAFVMAVGSGAAAVISAAKVQFYPQQEWYASIFSSFLAAVLILSVYIPVQLKFGAEKSRMVFFIIIAVIVGIGYIGKKAAEALHIDLTGIIDKVIQTDMIQATICLIVLIAALLGISFVVSVAVMKRKQF